MAAKKKQFVLTGAVWNSATEQLKEGQVVTFEDNEPTGVFIGRVRELTESENAIEVASPSKAEINQAAKDGEAEKQAEVKELDKAADAPVDTSKPVPVPPPAPKK